MGNQLHAVVYRDDQPYYELTAEEIGYHVPINRGSRVWDAFFFLKRYEPEAFLTAMREATVSQRVISADEIEDPEVESAAYRQFVDDHFLRMAVDGKIDSEKPEDHKRFLDSKFWLKEKIFEEGVYGARDDSQPEEDDEVFSLDLDDDLRQMRTTHSFWGNGQGAATLKFCHHVRQETESQYKRWRKASKARTSRKRKRRQYQSKPADLVKLYDEMIIRVDGFLIDGEPCTESNSDKWRPLIPAAEKLLVVGMIFERTIRGNV